MTLRFLLILMLWNLGASRVSCQEYSYLNYTPRNGLACSNAYSIMQDNEGYIWVCTENGISRFDGTTFRNFTSNDGLLENETFYSFQDSKHNRIWFSSFNKTKSYFYNDTINTIKNNEFLKSGHQLPFLKIYEDSKNRLWFYEASMVALDGQTWKKYFVPPFEIISEVYTDYDNKICFLGYKGLYHIVNDSLRLEVKFNIPEENMYHLKRGNMIISYLKNKISAFEIGKDSLRLRSERVYPYHINRLKVDKYSNLWICTAENGALKVDFITGDTTHYLNDKTVTDILIDKEDNTWFSTFGGGVYMLSSPHVNVYTKETGLASSNVCAVFGDRENNLWVGLHNGKINCINSTGIHVFSTSSIQGYNRVLNFAEGYDHIFCSSDQGVYKFNMTNPPQLMEDVTRSTKMIFVSPEGDLLLASSSMGRIYPFNGGSMKTILNFRFTAVIQDYFGSIFWGGLNGLYLQQNDSIRRYNSLVPELNVRVTYLAQAKDSGIWVATANAGVIYLNVKSGKVTVFNVSSGLNSNNCKHVFVDKYNTAWISTAAGLTQIKYRSHPFEQVIANYTSEDGLPIDEINQSFVRNDTVWVATVRGLASINLRNKKKYLAPAVFITSCQTQATTYLNPTNLNLKYWETRLHIKVSGLSFSAAGHIIYKYKLIGVDQDWNTTTSNEINYASLEPGVYKFFIYAMHPKGLMSRQPALMVVTVAQPFWKTSWFLISFAILTLVATFLIYKARVNVINRKSELDNKLLRSEIKALRAQINPHFIFNSLNSIQDFIFKSRKEDANQYLNEFSKLMRMILENSQTNMVSLADEILFLSSYLKLEKLRMGDRLTYVIENKVEGSLDRISIPSMILQPFVENAIVHGLYPKKGGGNLIVEFVLNGNQLICKITDTGIGYENSQAFKMSGNAATAKHHSTGIKNTRDRIDALNKIHKLNITFTIQSSYNQVGNADGTEVEIVIPEI